MLEIIAFLLFLIHVYRVCKVLVTDFLEINLTNQYIYVNIIIT